MTDKKEDGRDIAILGPPAPGGGVHVLRHRPDHSLEAGVMRPLEDGKPIYGEVVQIEAREDGMGYDILPTCPVGSGGPPMVNSKAYRDGWDGIFGKSPIGEA